ncbi:MAG: hypothetical protein GX621_11260 [Pirellulaceae bacterium]|nr:hypothetical protein [Pirellulaceae bacterium]
MKEYAATVLAYLAGGLIGCGLAAFVSSPFMAGTDFPISFQMMFVAVFTGFYMLLLLPFVVIAHVAMRAFPFHRFVPVASLSIFGALFPVGEFLLKRYRGWPEEPFDMDAIHWLVLLSIAALAIAVGVAAAYVDLGKLFAGNTRPKNLVGTIVAVERPRPLAPPVPSDDSGIPILEAAPPDDAPTP